MNLSSFLFALFGAVMSRKACGCIHCVEGDGKRERGSLQYNILSSLIQKDF